MKNIKMQQNLILDQLQVLEIELKRIKQSYEQSLYNRVNFI